MIILIYITKLILILEKSLRIRKKEKKKLSWPRETFRSLKIYRTWNQ